MSTNRRRSGAFVYGAAQLVGEISAVIFAVAQQSLVDAHSVCAVEPTLALAIILGLAFFFVAAVAAIVGTVAFVQFQDALAVGASEFAGGTGSVARIGFVAAIGAVLKEKNALKHRAFEVITAPTLSPSQ